MDALRLTVIWHPQLKQGQNIAEQIAIIFDRLGMVRDHVRLSVPVQVRSVGFDQPNGSPRPIDFSKAEVNGLILLSDHHMVSAARKGWRNFFLSVSQARAEKGPALFILNIDVDGKGVRLPLTLDDHVIGNFVGKISDFSGKLRRHFFIKLMTDMGVNLKRVQLARETLGDPPPRVQPEVIFLSHASLDGANVARWIDDYVRANKATLGIDTFLDAKSLPGGLGHRKFFSDQILEQLPFGDLYRQL